MSVAHRTPAEFWYLCGGDDIEAGVATVEEVLKNAGRMAQDLEPARKRQCAQFALNSLEDIPDAIDLVSAAFPGVDLSDNGQPLEAQKSNQLPQQSDSVNLLNFGFHDSGNADRIIVLFGEDMRYCPAYKKWLLWDGRRWINDEIRKAKKLAKQAMIHFLKQAVDRNDGAAEKFAKSSLNSGRIKAVLDLAEPELSITPDQLDQHSYLLNCNNGTLDLLTRELRPHRREDYLTKLVHFDYRPEARCDRFVRFVNEIMGATPVSSPSALGRVQELARYVQKLLGREVSGDVSEKIVACFFGDGDNGKTTFLEAVRYVISEYSHQVLIENLTVSKYAHQSNASLADLADLKGARFVTTSEGEKSQRLAESKIKYLSAGMGEIKACRKYENPIKFPATHKLFMDSNYKPIVRGTDTAIWNRLKTVPFQVTIPNDFVELDPLLPEKLKGEAEGILAWLVEGFLLWKKNDLGEPPEVTSANESWRSEMNPLQAFIGDRCHLSENQTCTIAQLWTAYLKWCDVQREQMIQRRDFNDRIEALGCRRKRQNDSRWWKGIGLLEG